VLLDAVAGFDDESLPELLDELSVLELLDPLLPVSEAGLDELDFFEPDRLSVL